jgi:hypothetical protein
MKKLNLIVGLILLLIFLGTGYQLATQIKPVHFSNPIVRMEARANHIYILFIALLNILSFRNKTVALGRGSILIEYFSRGLLIISGTFAVYAFVFEHTGNIEERQVTFLAVSTALISVALFVFNELMFQKKSCDKSSTETSNER